MPERRTPFHDYHLRSARQLVKGAGDYLFPLAYTSEAEEHVNTRTNVGMQDLSTMGEVDIQGPGAERLINHLLVNEIRDLHPGQLRYSTMCREDGGVVDDVTVYKFHDEHFMIVTSSAPRKKTHRWIADHAVGTSAYVTDLTAAIALPVVQGPRSKDFLMTVVEGADLEDLRYFHFVRAQIGEAEFILSRSGYTGELGYELYVPAEEAGAVWDHLLKAGREFSLMPYGTLAMQSLRLEKAYPLYGVDLEEDHTPFHAGLDRWIRFDKREFIGREALLRTREMGIDERWVGLEIHGGNAALPDAGVYSIAEVETLKEKIFTGSEAGEYLEQELPGVWQVGRVTYSAKGHSLGKMLAMAYVSTAHAWPGSRLLVDVSGRPTPATVTRTPFFDPEGVRLRAAGPRRLERGAGE